MSAIAGYVEHEQRVAQRKTRLAAVLWLAPYFFAVASFGPNEDFILPTRYIEWVALGALALTTVAVWLTRIEVARVVIATVVLIGTTALYLLFGPTLSFGSQADYVWAATGLCVIFGLTVFYGAVFFREGDFVEVFFRLSAVSAVVAVASYAVSFVVRQPILVNFRGLGGLADYRLQGLLSEPSAWGPIVPTLLILGWRRRSRSAIALGLLVLCLAQSPSVLIITMLSLAAYSALISEWSRGRVLIIVGLVAAVAGGVVIVTGVDGRALQASSSGFVAQYAGRLIVGVQAALEGTDDGDARQRNTEVVLADAQAEGNPAFGYGLNSSSTYFDAKYPGEGGVRPTGTWTRAVFDAGWIGATLVIAAIVVAACRLARRRDLAAIFLPVFVASGISGPHQLGKMVLLGVLLFAFGWHSDQKRVNEVNALAE